MTVGELAEVLYRETPVEVCVDFDPVFKGTAEAAQFCRYLNRNVEEVYISLDGVTLVVEIDGKRKPRK